MRKVNHRREIYPVFRELFGRKDARAEAEARVESSTGAAEPGHISQ